MSKEPIKILLIDDEVQFVDTLKDRLFLRGFDAAVAYNGEDGQKGQGQSAGRHCP